MQNYTVELRKEPGRATDAFKVISITCKPNQLIGTVAEKYPGWLIVRYY